MPRILLVNCPDSIGDALRANAEYQVTSVVRSTRLPSSPTDVFPDPGKFDIVIDDSSNVEPDGQAKSAAEGTVVVPHRYTDDLRDANALVYVPFGVHGMTDHGERFRYIQRKARPRYLEPEWRVASASAEFFRNFILEFEPQLEAVVFENPQGISTHGNPPASDVLHIYDDEYGDPRIFAYFVKDDRCRVLVTPNIRDSRKGAACKYLLDHVFPFFAPHAYTDVLVPSTLRALRDEWVAEHTRFRERMAELERLQEEEEEFYAPYKAVIRLLGDPLHELVGRVFQDVWGLRVDNLDAIAESQGERRKADLLLELQDWRGLVEVTGGGRRAGTFQTDLEPFLKHIEEHEAELGPIPARILLFNPHAARPLAERLALQPWAPDLEEDARSAGVTLMTTFELFGTLELRREGRLDTPGLVRALSTPGRFAAAL